jgi:fused signal recognition particle receptor
MFESLKKKLKNIFSKSKDIVEEKSIEEKPVLEESKSQEHITEPIKEEVKEEPKIDPVKEKEPPKEEKKEGLLGGLIKKVTEKELSEKDVDKILDELKIALVENDVAFEAADKITERTKETLIGKKVGRRNVEEEITKALRDSIYFIMKQPSLDIKKLIEEKDGVVTILIFGFNGAGKTTTIAKLATKLKEFKPVVAAGDTFRAASIEQLEEHAKKAGFDLVKHTYGSDSAAVIFDAKKHAESTGSKIVLGDTAGRSHSDVNLMDELKKVVKVNNPDLKILVLDALAGNDIYEQAKAYEKSVGIDAIILTKTDVYNKGGACLSASYVTNKPILYLGTGQEYEDLQEFDADKIVNNLL